MDANDIVKSAEILKEAFLKVASTMAMSDGRLDETEIEVIAGFCSRFTGDIVTTSTVAEMALPTNSSKDSLNTYLESVRDDIPIESKEILIHAAYNVAIADGEFCDQEKTLLVDISIALGLNNEHRDTLLDKLCENESNKQSNDDLLKYALIKTMTSMVLADNMLNVSEIDSLADIFRHFSGNHVGVKEIEEIAHSIATDSFFHLPHYLLSIKDRLSDVQKENLVRAAICAANADEEAVKEEALLLNKIAKSLGISADRLQIILSERMPY